jgi:hypothetical protein
MESNSTSDVQAVGLETPPAPEPPPSSQTGANSSVGLASLEKCSSEAAPKVETSFEPAEIWCRLADDRRCYRFLLQSPGTVLELSIPYIPAVEGDKHVARTLDKKISEAFPNLAGNRRGILIQRGIVEAVTQDLRGRHNPPPTETPKEEVIPKEVYDQALRMLKNPEILKELADDLRTIGLAGEEKLATLVYVIGSSRLQSRPLAGIVIGHSSSGKSYTISRVGSLFPATEVVNDHSASPLSFLYAHEGSLKHRFVIAGERPRKQGADEKDAHRARRELLSDGRVSRQVNGKTLCQEGPIAFIESTSAQEDEVFEDDRNRCLILKPDTSPEQTKRILNEVAHRKAIVESPEKEKRILQKHWVAQLMLRRCVVTIPYAEQLPRYFDPHRLQNRRRFPDVLSLIEAVALLRQYQSLEEPQDGATLKATRLDYEIARDLLVGDHIVIDFTKPGPERAMCRRVREWVKEQDFTVKEISKADPDVKDESTIRKYLKALGEAGCVEKVKKEEGEGKAVKYRLTKKAFDDATLLSLPPADEICIAAPKKETAVEKDTAVEVEILNAEPEPVEKAPEPNQAEPAPKEEPAAAVA